MQNITPEIRKKFREVSSEIRRIDETIRNDYERIEDFESSSYSTNDNDIAMRETDVQRMIERRASLTLELRKMNRDMAMRKTTIKTL